MEIKLNNSRSLNYKLNSFYDEQSFCLLFKNLGTSLCVTRVWSVSQQPFMSSHKYARINSRQLDSSWGTEQICIAAVTGHTVIISYPHLTIVSVRTGRRCYINSKHYYTCSYDRVRILPKCAMEVKITGSKKQREKTGTVGWLKRCEISDNHVCGFRGRLWVFFTEETTRSWHLFCKSIWPAWWTEQVQNHVQFHVNTDIIV